MSLKGKISDLTSQSWWRYIFYSSFMGLCLCANISFAYADAFYRLDSGAGLVVHIKKDKATSSLRGPGDIISLRYKGVEYQDPMKGSHVNSGFRGLYPDQKDVAVIRMDTPEIQRVSVHVGALWHAYMVRRGENILYMSTYFTREPRPNLVRFIARIPHSKLPQGIQAAQVNKAVRLIEAHDVFANEDGQTRSKHYSNARLMDWRYFGGRGEHVGIWFVRDNNEGGSGGPFYRSLREQGATDQELTYIINYGEAQTESYRTHIANRYAMVFNDGQAPQNVDMGWQEQLGLPGLTPREKRGTLKGRVPLNNDERQPYLVALCGPTGQYWARPQSLDGRFNIAGVRPGNYQAILYRGELKVGTRTVTVREGRESTLAFVPPSRWFERPVFWRIGTWDGTPLEFRNGRKLTSMHPSDPRMQSWSVSPYNVEAFMAWDFPACQWQDVNNDIHVHFPLHGYPSRPVVLRIGITTAYGHGRPDIVLNGWHSRIVAPSEQPKTRNLTVGTYRGNNTIWTYKIPSSALREGANDLAIHVASGSHGHGFLSPGYSFDALEMGYE